MISLFLGSSLERDLLQWHSLLWRTTEGDFKDLVLEVWWVLHITFLKCESKSHPSEKLWFLTAHLLVSQDPSPVPGLALTLGFQKPQPHLISKPLLYSVGLCFLMSSATAEVQTSHCYLDLCDLSVTQLDIKPEHPHLWSSSWADRPLTMSLTDLICPEAVHFLWVWLLTTPWIGPR